MVSVAHRIDDSDEPCGALQVSSTLGSDCQGRQPVPNEPSVIEVSRTDQALVQEVLSAGDVALLEDHIAQARQRQGRGPRPPGIPKHDEGLFMEGGSLLEV